MRRKQSTKYYFGTSITSAIDIIKYGFSNNNFRLEDQENDSKTYFFKNNIDDIKDAYESSLIVNALENSDENKVAIIRIYPRNEKTTEMLDELSFSSYVGIDNELLNEEIQKGNIELEVDTISNAYDKNLRFLYFSDCPIESLNIKSLSQSEMNTLDRIVNENVGQFYLARELFVLNKENESGFTSKEKFLEDNKDLVFKSLINKCIKYDILYGEPNKSVLIKVNMGNKEGWQTIPIEKAIEDISMRDLENILENALKEEIGHPVKSLIVEQNTNDKFDELEML